MRIESIALSWFRGAAESVSLEANGRSIVVYGPNASGKSSFVDALEFLIQRGKVTHLTHEYSGRRQEKAIINTHKPPSAMTSVTISFNGGLKQGVTINSDGNFTSTDDSSFDLTEWEYQRVVLRQDEVARFIHNTKGEKYSALLPLLGLQSLETCAENLRLLAKALERKADVEGARGRIAQNELRIKTEFPNLSPPQILKEIQAIHLSYNDDLNNVESLEDVIAMEECLEQRIAQFSTAQNTHLILSRVSTLDLAKYVKQIRAANSKLSNQSEPFLTERMSVFEAAEELSAKLEPDSEVVCPACGTRVGTNDFQAHVASEQVKLTATREIYEERRTAVAALCDQLLSMKTALADDAVAGWRTQEGLSNLRDGISLLDDLDVGKIRRTCTESDLENCQLSFEPIIRAAVTETKQAPPEVKALADAQKKVETAKLLFDCASKHAELTRAGGFINFIRSVEARAREEIKSQSKRIIDEISDDIRSMWEILHPNDKIDQIRLYLPEDTDKAIDIGLRFYGVDQDSPRLTLSEGFRNSLGLCIFLSMAKRKDVSHQPIVLDDVVVSMDRNHRGMIVGLLDAHFSDRQVVILTHDRDWFADLRSQLDEAKWTWQTILPYESPEVGIRLSSTRSDFDDARALLKSRPDSAGTDARKILDLQLALIAEKLKLRLPYVRAEKNDRRMAQELLKNFISAGKRCFKRKVGDNHSAYEDPLVAWKAAIDLLVTWANRGTHSFDVVPEEASQLIDACERALSFFRCAGCRQTVWHAEVAGAEYVQCSCGALRWQYGKDSS